MIKLRPLQNIRSRAQTLAADRCFTDPHTAGHPGTPGHLTGKVYRYRKRAPAPSGRSPSGRQRLGVAAACHARSGVGSPGRSSGLVLAQP